MIARDKSPARIRQLCEFHSVPEVAAMFRITADEVLDVLEGVKKGKRCEVMLRCNLTGRTWTCRSWRAAHFRVCLLGLVDWDWFVAAKYRAWLAQQQGAAQ